MLSSGLEDIRTKLLVYSRERLKRKVLGDYWEGKKESNPRRGIKASLLLVWRSRQRGGDINERRKRMSNERVKSRRKTSERMRERD